MTLQLSLPQMSLVSDVFSAHNAIGYSEIVSKGHEITVIRELVEAGILEKRLKPEIPCPACNRTMGIRLDIGYTCTSCGRVILLEDDHLLEHSTYRASVQHLVKTMRNHLVNEGFNLISTEESRIAGVYAIGRIQSGSEGELDLVLLAKPLSTTTLSALLGDAIAHSTNTAVFIPSSESGFERSQSELIAFPKLLTMDLPLFGQEPTMRNLERFLSHSAFLSSIIASIREVTGSDQSLFMTRDEVQFLENARRLSQTGRKRFEPIALRLLQPLGITSRFKAGGYGPDGMLYLPDEFYIVDAKSTESQFEFRVEERDKIHRYIRAIEDNCDFLGEYGFSGEIIVTPSLKEPHSDTLDKVEEYFSKNPINGRLVIISSDALIDLHRSIFADLEYFHRLQPKHHVKDLLSGRLSVDPTGDSPQFLHVVYVGEETMQRFYSLVLDSPALSMRSVSYLDSWIESVY